jgi:glycosyltransferase involved in cell wall biosynthesis
MPAASAPSAATLLLVRSVLHVLPHPGGGGETYVDTLERMGGFEFERFFLAPSPDPRDALRTLWRTGVDLQLRARKHDLVHAHGEVASGFALPSLALRPSVVTLNGLHLLRRLDGFAGLAAVANIRLVVAASSRTICVSNAERDQTLEVVGRRSKPRLLVIPNSVDLAPEPTSESRAEARRALGLPANAVVAAWVGSLDTRKDPLLAARAAIEVARRGTPFSLLVAGDGPLRPALEQLAATGEAVHFLGFRHDVRSVLASADLFVVSSHREGLPYSLLEAMATGLPAVVSDEPGTVEGVGDAGIVVRSRDVGAFADGLSELARDKPRRLELGRRARARVATHYSADEMVRRTATVYESALGARRG